MSTNPYKLLRDLLPDAPLLVGTVQSISNGTATIAMPGTGLSTARCAEGITVGMLVFFRDSVVEGQAPTLPVEVIEV